MNQSLGTYNPPSYTSPFERDYQTFWRSLTDYLVNQLGQYQVGFFQQVVNILNTATQGFGNDLASAATISPTNWGHRITGNATIQTITPPNGFQSSIVLLALGSFSLGSAGNIAIAKGPFNIGEHAMLVYSPIDNLWYPKG